MRDAILIKTYAVDDMFPLELEALACQLSSSAAQVQRNPLSVVTGQLE
jgi:hypothetical protein